MMSEKKKITKKLWYICIMEYYSHMKQNEILSFVTNWVNLEIIQAEKDKCHLISIKI